MIPLTVPQILQAAQQELMRQYGRHQAPHIWQAIHAAMTVHDARTAALAATFAAPIRLDEAVVRPVHLSEAIA